MVCVCLKRKLQVADRGREGERTQRDTRSWRRGLDLKKVTLLIFSVHCHQKLNVEPILEVVSKLGCQSEV